MLLIKPKVFLYFLGNAQHFFFLERQCHYLDADRHSLSIFEIVSDELSAWILPIAFIVQLILSRDSDGLRDGCHSQNVEQICISSQK